jgi:hypothetical protein
MALLTDEENSSGIVGSLIGKIFKGGKGEGKKKSGEELDNPLSEMNKFNQGMATYKMEQDKPLMPDWDKKIAW